MLDVDIYQMRLFTIFNNAALFSADPSKNFKYLSDDEETEELIKLAEFAKSRGLSL